MKKKLSLLMAAAMMLSFTGCLNGKSGGASQPKPDKETARRLSDPVIPSDSDDFDMALMSCISKNVSGSYMISPLSFRFALGLLLSGTAGETKTELLSALGVSDEEEWKKYCADFGAFAEKFDGSLKRDIEEYNYGVLNGYITKDEPEPYRALRVANSVWKNEGLGVELKKSYTDGITSDYSAEQFSFTADDAVKRVNDWVNDKTEGMIPVLLGDDYDASDLAVILMNALYFKDAWEYSFSKALTEKKKFTLADGTKVKKEFMTVQEDFLYYEDADSQIVVLPMKGGESMVFVLGSAEDLKEKLAAAEYETVKVTVPKLELETSLSNGELMEFLRSRGAERIFADGDFSAMTDSPISVDDIIQKTKIKLDEDGVEAAAVTAIMIKCLGIPQQRKPKIFTADRPFAFFIVDGTAEMHTLFAGEIRD